MQTVTDITKEKRTRGRKDADRQEKVIEVEAVKDRVEELIRLYKASGDAQEAFNDGIKKAAEDSGLLAATVRKFVVARAGEKFEEEKRKCEQLSLLFEEIGE